MKRAILLLAVLVAALTSSACLGNEAEKRAARENEEFRDLMRQAARLPKYAHSDDRIRDALMKAALERGLGPFIASRQFVIETSDHRRKITCEYERTIELAPGKTKALRFKNEVEEPLL